MVVFKIRDSVPSAIYSRICNALRLWSIWLIPTYANSMINIEARIAKIVHEGRYRWSIKCDNLAIANCDHYLNSPKNF